MRTWGGKPPSYQSKTKPYTKLVLLADERVLIDTGRTLATDRRLVIADRFGALTTRIAYEDITAVTYGKGLAVKHPGVAMTLGLASLAASIYGLIMAFQSPTVAVIATRMGCWPLMLLAVSAVILAPLMKRRTIWWLDVTAHGRKRSFPLFNANDEQVEAIHRIISEALAGHHDKNVT